MTDDSWTCGGCRHQFDDREIVPHMKSMHPGLADDLQQWPDGRIATGLVQDVEIYVPEEW